MSPMRFCAAILLLTAGFLPCRGESPTVQAIRAQEEVTIDGGLDETLWRKLGPAKACSASGWTSIAAPGRPAFDQRSVSFAWDEENLYVAITAVFGDESSLTDPAAAGEDTLRIDLADSALGIASSGEQLKEILIPYLIPIRAAARETDNGWTAEMAIPWAQLKISPKPGLKIIFNVAGRDLSGEISWAPVRNFRDVERFGTLELR